MSSSPTDGFKPGDLVQLKSGGPIMTVERVPEHGGVWASWFAYADRRNEHFASESLQRAEALRARPSGTWPDAPAARAPSPSSG